MAFGSPAGFRCSGSPAGAERSAERRAPDWQCLVCVDHCLSPTSVFGSGCASRGSWLRTAVGVHAICGHVEERPVSAMAVTRGRVNVARRVVQEDSRGCARRGPALSCRSTHLAPLSCS